MKLRVNDYAWISGIGLALVISAIYNINNLKFVGIIFIVRGVLGLIIREEK